MNDLRPTERFVDGGTSYWLRAIEPVKRRAPLPSSTEADVAIVGAGLTGLWAAYYLARADPGLRIVVLEKEFAGFGASGRNGGWLSAEPPGQFRRYARSAGHDAAVRLQRAMFAAVDEVVSVAQTEGIDADIVKDGLLHVATNPAQERRLRSGLPALRREGWGFEDLRLLEPGEVAQRVRIPKTRAATYSPHCARIQPAKLVRGLADVVERRAVRIFENTTVDSIEPGRVVTNHGTVRATHVLRCTEGFTAGISGFHREWLPMASSMIVTEPLPKQAMDEIGWHGAELVGDEAHAFAYVQRTKDDRIALGGRAVPYRFGSRTDRDGETMGDTVEKLREVLGRHFPAARAVGIDHAWSGVLGVPRDWCATVGLDESTGLGWAGGYVGHGVTSTNLAGRTLADLVLRHDSDLVSLPWVGRRVRRWEPEPIRWLAVHGLYAAYRTADRHEFGRTSARTSSIALIADRISGRS